MRLFPSFDFRLAAIRHALRCAALAAAAAALAAASPLALAQSPDAAGTARDAAIAPVAADAHVITDTAPSPAAAQGGAPIDTAGVDKPVDTAAPAPADPPIAGTDSTGGFGPLDDQTLSRQRGGSLGMVMVATSPQFMRGGSASNAVTLWDEIAPPTPLPIPVDASQAAQNNIQSYFRK